MAEQELMPVEQTLPRNLFILPLVGNPIFPGLFTPLVIESKEDIEIVNQALNHGGNIGLLLVKDENKVDYEADNMYRVGTVAKIIKRIKLPDGGMNIFISTIKRFQVKEFHTGGKFTVADVTYLEDIEDNPTELKAWTRQLINETKKLSRGNPLFTEEMRLNMVNIDQSGKMADFIASIINIDRRGQQRILETLNVRRRMERVLVHIKKEQQVLQMQEQIQSRVNSKLEKNQREYFLREELKHIQHELGLTSDPRTAVFEKISKQIGELKLEGEVAEAVKNELDKFQSLDPNSPEYSITRNYLETIAALPWNDSEPEDFTLESASKILERDHYGLRDVKDRILEYLAVRKKKKDTKGSIICLVGPPGVGKTSVGKSIASALKKEYYRFSVGGMRDEAEIKGHRRTYIGAMPGKIIQGLKTVKKKNPVFLIDEIDKMGTSYQGDPASALLEVLDSEQNFSFRDHYLDLPFDVSQILFIVTANSLETIPRALLDRMEVISLSGYTSKEKLAIGRKYLVPKSLKKHGLLKSEVSYSKTILNEIADSYAREAGVRNYEKSLDKIHRKVAREIVEGHVTPPVKITQKRMSQYLGKPYFYEDEIKKADRPGMAVGLAWTSMGGDTLIIEAVSYPGKGELKLTGKLGEVMQESASIALTHLKSISQKYGLDVTWFDTHSIHLHVPEGATPKDGPSAGITMATTFFSLITNTAIKEHLAMTGELDLIGKVMPIGGLKEKVLAARRNNITTIIIPKHNKRDLDELDSEITEGITFHPVGSFDEALPYIFDSAPKLIKG